MFGYNIYYITKQLEFVTPAYSVALRDDALGRIASHMNLLVPSELSDMERDFIKRVALLAIEITQEVQY